MLDETSAHPTDAGQKALAINLDPLRYGSFAEIGAGQEVARWFFQVGAAAGTVAKSTSAYDMAVSDAIYGKAQRYVSRERLQAMLDREHRLNVERLSSSRGSTTAFFSYADTVSAQSFRGNPDCHAWMGIRFQCSPEAEDSQIVLHVKMKDAENLQQQEALGIIGVNLVYGAFYFADDIRKLISSLLDGLTTRRVEIDMIEFSGAAFERVDNRVLSLKLVDLKLTPSAIFSAGGRVLQASDTLYKKPVLVQRGSFRPPTKVHYDMHTLALAQMAEIEGIDPKSILSVAEMTMSNLTADSEGNWDQMTKGFLERVDILAPSGLTCVVTRYPEYFRIAEELTKFTTAPIGMAMGADTLRAIFEEHYYEALDGGILEAMGRLFKNNLRLYIYPYQEPQTGALITANNLEVAPPVRSLYQHLLEQGSLHDLQGYNEDYLAIRSAEVLDLIRSGEGWERFLTEPVMKQIKATGQFGYSLRSID